MDYSMLSPSGQDEAKSPIPPLCSPETLRGWLSACETTHQWCPWKHPTIPIPFRLLDVNTLCIKDFINRSERPLRYAVLSYVWGTKPQRLRLTQANKDILHLDGAIEITQLSRTISDAVSVVRMLGEQYIWVDSLCIIQDSKDDLEFQIPLVGYIFAKSLVTIVAASGDHNDVGLPGINGWQRQTSPGRLQQLQVVQPHPFQFGILPYLGGTVWETRGWTYQEKILSRRCLVFTEELVYWECHCASWSEDTPMEIGTLEQMRQHDMYRGFFLSDDHFIREGHSGEHHGLCITHMVPSFTARHLTYDQDTSRAFAGLLQVLKDLGQYNFVHGISTNEGQFVSCLLWLDNGGCALRKQQEVPTWAWLAWKGSIFMFNDDKGSDIECYFVRIDDHGDRFLSRVDENSEENKELHLDYQQIPETRRSHLKTNFHLLFWAETAMLLVEEDGKITNRLQDEEAVTYEELGSGVNGSAHGLAGDQTFFRVRTHGVMFCPGENTIDAMIIVWDHGIAYRKSTATIDLRIWTAARPKRELVILG